ncbi:MAG: hypothetical protein ACI4SX_07995, partial [Candidatus Fimenecus sp.]
FAVLSLGTWLILWNCVLILGQILILRKQFKLIQLLQIPLSVLFGWFTDFGMWLAEIIPTQFYPVRLLSVFAGTAILGFGIALAVITALLTGQTVKFFQKRLQTPLRKILTK